MTGESPHLYHVGIEQHEDLKPIGKPQTIVVDTNVNTNDLREWMQVGPETYATTEPIQGVYIGPDSSYNRDGNNRFKLSKELKRRREKLALKSMRINRNKK